MKIIKVLCTVFLSIIAVQAHNNKRPFISLTEIEALSPQQEYVYINDDTRDAILKAEELLPHYSWSDDFKHIHYNLTHGTTIVEKNIAEKIVNEYLEALTTSGITDAAKDWITYYKHALSIGDSALSVTSETIDRSRSKKTVICNLLVKDCLKVAGGLEVDGCAIIKDLNVGKLSTSELHTQKVVITGDGQAGNDAATVAFVKEYVDQHGPGNVTVKNLGSGEGVFGIYKPSTLDDTEIDLRSLMVDSTTGLIIEPDSQDTVLIIKTNGTSANIPQTLVQRDSNGDFSAGIITANLNGHATNFTGDLAGDVTGKQDNTVVETVGTKTASAISTAVNAFEAATSTDISNTLVKRDANGDFSARIITADLNGNATNFTGDLAGDVTGTQDNTIVETVGTKTASAISTAVNAFEAATSTDTSNTLVKRDANGDFSARIITADLNGNATNFTGDLAGDVTGTQDNTVVQMVGTKTASAISTAVNAFEAATNADTSNTLVKRDANGDFQAHAITVEKILPEFENELASKKYVDDSTSGGGTPITIQNVDASGVGVFKDENPNNTYNFKKLVEANGIIIDASDPDQKTITIKTNASLSSVPNTLVMRNEDSDIFANRVHASNVNLTVDNPATLSVLNDPLLRSFANKLCIYIGKDSGKSVDPTSISNETAFGYGALQNSGTGVANTAVGAQALLVSNAGKRNTAIGNLALVQITGNDNTALGAHAGFSLESGSSNNIFIGSQVGALSSTFSDSNTINIGLTSNTGSTAAHTKCTIGGIYNQPGHNPSRKAVFIDQFGRLHTEASSVEISNIHALELNPAFLNIKPVSFYAHDHLEYGFIPEDVYAAMPAPALVVLNEEKKPIDINYKALAVLQQCALQKLNKKVEEQGALISKMYEQLQKTMLHIQKANDPEQT